MSRRDQDFQRLLELIRSRAVEKNAEGFTLASGRKSTLYVDLRRVTQDPVGINLIGTLVLEKIREVAPEARFVGGLETGSIPIATAVSLLSVAGGKALGAFWVRKKPKDHGLQNRIEGNLERGAKVVIVDDTVTTGASSMQAAEEVKYFGANVVQAIAVVDRGASDSFSRANLPYYFFYSEEDLA